MTATEPSSQGVARTRFRSAPTPRARTLAGRLAGRARWLGWELRTPPLRGGPPVNLAAGAAITVAGAGRLVRGEHVVVKRDVTLALQAPLTVGARAFIGRGSHITCFAGVTLGDDVRFGERVSVHDENHVFEPLSDRDGRATEYLVAPVAIGDRVWLGANVVVLPGVTIGEDTVVAAGSVVAKDLPAGVLAAGAPATVVRPLRRD
jgi:acetyltransferase-like isoleucine patch superfamily enzyme